MVEWELLCFESGCHYLEYLVNYIIESVVNDDVDATLFPLVDIIEFVELTHEFDWGHFIDRSLLYIKSIYRIPIVVEVTALFICWVQIIDVQQCLKIKWVTAD